MPQWFGSYTVLIIAVVVLLVAALGLILVRRKSSGDSRAKAEKVSSAQAGKSTRESRKATAIAAKAAEADAEQQQAAVAAQALGASAESTAAPETASPESTATPETAMATVPTGAADSTAQAAAQPVDTVQVAAQAVETPGVENAPPAAAAALPDSNTPSAQPAPVAPSGERFDLSKPADREAPIAPPLSAPSADPLQTVISSILQGWGDITAEDTNRLAVFRKEKVGAALAAVELPKDHKSNEYAKTRLTQLRRYANQLEQGERPLGSPASEHEFVGMVGSAPAVSPPTSPTAATTRPVSVATAPIAKPATAEPGPGPSVSVSDEPAGIASHAFAVPKDAEQPWTLPTKWDDVKVTTRSTDPWTLEEDVSAAEERAAEFDWGTEETDIPHMSAQIKPPEAAKPGPSSADEAHRSAEAAVAAAAAAFWGTPEAPALDQKPVPSKSADAPTGTHAEETVPSYSMGTKAASDPFAGLGAKVSTAADIMALPISERVDMLAFLEPPELSKVFFLAADRDLKKSVIDTLEHIGNTSSLDALRGCLEDPDPEVQLHALEAADRMLGTSH